MDWKSTIAELQRRGYSQPKIAELCDCGQATISDLATGKTTDPRHSLAVRLQGLLDSKQKVRAAVKPQKKGH